MESISSKVRFSKRFLGVELKRSLPTMSILTRSNHWNLRYIKKIKEFTSFFKTNVWVH